MSSYINDPFISFADAIVHISFSQHVIDICENSTCKIKII
jgi:hypothetical protein